MGWKMSTVIQLSTEKSSQRGQDCSSFVIHWPSASSRAESRGYSDGIIQLAVSRNAFVSVSAGHVQVPQLPRRPAFSVTSSLCYAYIEHKSHTVTLNIWTCSTRSCTSAQANKVFYVKGRGGYGYILWAVYTYP